MSGRRSVDGKPITHWVTVRRRNGRLVRSYPVASRYAAKVKVDRLEVKYGDTDFSIEIEPANV